LSWVPRGQALNASAFAERLSQIELGSFRMRYRSHGPMCWKAWRP
jgi:hypothetical protein